MLMGFGSVICLIVREFSCWNGENNQDDSFYKTQSWTLSGTIGNNNEYPLSRRPLGKPITRAQTAEPVDLIFAQNNNDCHTTMEKDSNLDCYHW